ncbi:hypothetical protein [Phaeospirillum tilakii]|uniref:Uncharacterized protein n=1 Tax=Phaeospirillum tilakii TaxID=741673 RepID=A0ABW5CAB1_9PROT
MDYSRCCNNFRRIRHIIACATAVLMALLITKVSGISYFTEKFLHKWLHDLLIIFALLFFICVVLLVRGRFSRAMWPVIIGVALAYACSALSYAGYFYVFNEYWFVGSGVFSSLLSNALVILIIAPFASMSWAFGAIFGFLFIVINKILCELKQLPRGHDFL